MSRWTGIEWCDSTGNIQMGCNGCELWNPRMNIRVCYAGIQTEKRAGNKGWPADFNKPELFLGRLRSILDWPDLTGTERIPVKNGDNIIAAKPWFDGYPRVIFWNDMGDAWSEDLDIDWMLPAFAEMEKTPHIHIHLTKRPWRMAKAFEQYGHVPKRFWLMTTVTAMEHIKRVPHLLSIPGADVYGLSCEPLWDWLHLPLWKCPNCMDWRPGHLVNSGKDWGCMKCGTYLTAWFEREKGIGWVIGGAESGINPRPFQEGWALSLRTDCQAARVPFFWKQNLGGKHVGGRMLGHRYYNGVPDMPEPFPVEPESQGSLF